MYQAAGRTQLRDVALLLAPGYLVLLILAVAATSANPAAYQMFRMSDRGSQVRGRFRKLRRCAMLHAGHRMVRPRTPGLPGFLLYARSSTCRMLSRQTPSSGLPRPPGQHGIASRESPSRSRRCLRFTSRSLRLHSSSSPGGRYWRFSSSRGSAVSESRSACTATSRTGRSRPRGGSSSFSASWAVPRSRRDRCGGRSTTACTIAIPTGRTTRTRRLSMGSGTGTLAGCSRAT